MNSRNSILVFIFMLVSMLAETKIGFGQVLECFSIEINSSNNLKHRAQTSVAENDTFYYVNSCGNDILTGTVLDNDKIVPSDSLKICYVKGTSFGILSFGNNGKFTFVCDIDFEGEVRFEYRLCHINNPQNYTLAKVLIVVEKDNDCDEITNKYDLDNDNDGILDIHEGEGLIDTDLDNIPDNFDIDSDNDGIADIVEWQREGSYFSPSGIDSNKDGWDDAFDGSIGGEYYEQTDTDLDGILDYIDLDSDDDGILDFIEAYDVDSSGIANINPSYLDKDLDGLDDAFDTVADWTNKNNPFGCISPLPDLNKNGIRDWREDKNLIPLEYLYEQKRMYIYPNPTKNKFSVFVPIDLEEQKVELFIYTMSGKLVLTKKITAIENEVEMPVYNTGIFIVKFKTKDFWRTDKLIIN